MSKEAYKMKDFTLDEIQQLIATFPPGKIKEAIDLILDTDEKLASEEDRQLFELELKNAIGKKIVAFKFISAWDTVTLSQIILEDGKGNGSSINLSASDYDNIVFASFKDTNE